MGKTVFANILFALVYLASVILFFMYDGLNRETIVFVFAHFSMFAALAFRRESVTKAEICRTFVVCIMLITTLTWLPISGLWTLLPFWITGYFHCTKVSYDETVGCYVQLEMSEEAKIKTMKSIGFCVCTLVTFCIIFS